MSDTFANHLPTVRGCLVSVDPRVPLRGDRDSRVRDVVILAWNLGGATPMPVLLAPALPDELVFIHDSVAKTWMLSPEGTTFTSWADVLTTVHARFEGKDLSTPALPPTAKPDVEPPRRPPLGPRAASPRHPREAVP